MSNKTVDGAYTYVSKKVPEATGQNQFPVKKGSSKASSSSAASSDSAVWANEQTAE